MSGPSDAAHPPSADWPSPDEDSCLDEGDRGTVVHLRLFVAGSTLRSMRAIARVKRACEALPDGRCVLEVVDIYQQPALAQADQIIATPTLIRIRPAPVRYFVGDMSDLSPLIAGLRLPYLKGNPL